MNVRNKLVAVGLAGSALIGSAVTAAPGAQAATTVCGSICVSLYNLVYAKSDVLGVVGANGTNAYTGQTVDLQPESNTNQAEDWALNNEDTVADFYAYGLVSAELNLHYSNDYAYEFQYAPDATPTGLCLGVSGTAAEGSAVSLQACGVSAATLWVFDTADQYKRYIPLINGTDTNFSEPFVLTANSSGVNVTTDNLTGTVGEIENGQYWATEYGALS